MLKRLFFLKKPSSQGVVVSCVSWDLRTGSNPSQHEMRPTTFSLLIMYKIKTMQYRYGYGIQFS